MRSFPIRLNFNLTPGITKIHRYLDCSLYSKCLNKAVRRKWKTFSCIECGIFKKYKKERIENGKR